MNKQQMLQAIDNMKIYEKDYNTLLNLLENADDAFFVKVLEEIFKGNLYISDFELIFSDPGYIEMLKNNIENQEELKKEIDRLVDYRKNILKENYSNNPLTTEIGIEKPSELNVDIYNFYNNIVDETRDDLIYQMLETSNIEASTRYRLLQAINDPNSGITKEDILLFKNEYIIPIDHRYQILTNVDKDFMIKNNISEEQMKKIKSLSIFMRRKYGV
jgi:DNA mismatch repair ATPase MutS